MPDKKCEELVKQEKFKELYDYCTDRLSIQPDEEEYLFYQATALTLFKDLDKADAIFTKLFNRTKNYLYLICRGLTRFLAEKYDEGKADLHEAIGNDDSYGDMMFIFQIASDYYDLDDAKEALTKAITIDKKATTEELEQFFEHLSENASAGDRLLFVRIMELLKSL